jgi:hypothetical protein
MLAKRALSIAFWSAARLLLISFFYIPIKLALLVLYTAFCPDLICAYLWFLALLEESILSSLFLGLFCSEVFWLRDLLNLLLIYSRDVDLVGCGNDISCIDSSERNTIDLEGASNQENALVKSLEKDNTLSPESTSKKNQNSSGLQ